jgi:hypothetical protein
MVVSYAKDSKKINGILVLSRRTGLCSYCQEIFCVSSGSYTLNISKPTCSMYSCLFNDQSCELCFIPFQTLSGQS